MCKIIRSLSCCIIQVRLSLRSKTDCSTVSFGIFIINGSINCSKSPKSWRKKAAHHHHHFYLLVWYSFYKVHFTTRITGRTTLNIFPKLLEIIKMFLMANENWLVFFVFCSCLRHWTSHLCLIFESCSQACSSFDVLLFFLTIWMSREMILV